MSEKRWKEVTAEVLGLVDANTSLRELGHQEAQQLQSLLDQHEVSSIQTLRVKELSESLYKLGGKGCLTSITDLLGLRLIFNTVKDLEKSTSLIRKYYGGRIDEENSPDKLTPLGTDKMGYRSVHLVVNAPDFTALAQIFSSPFKFEIQLRTLLQHAWAENEHDYYKATYLPRELRRKMNLISASLEQLDQAILNIGEELETAKATLTQKIRNQEFNEELDELTLALYLEYGRPYLTLLEKFPCPGPPTWRTRVDRKSLKILATELRAKKLATISDLNARIMELMNHDEFPSKLVTIHESDGACEVLIELIIQGLLDHQSPHP